MADGSHSAIRAQALELKGRAMFSALMPLNAVIEAPGGLSFTPMTTDGVWGEMHVAIEGEWLGHHRGPFAITADTMRQCIAVFAKQANPMMVDYEHKSVQGGDGRAAGWIHALQMRDGGNGAELWATVEWVRSVADMIRAGEYRYCSPFIDFGPVDRKSGEDLGVELVNVAITNLPFLDGMHPIALSRRTLAVVPPELAKADEGEDDKPEDKVAEGEGEGDTSAEGEGDDEKPGAIMSDPGTAPAPEPTPDETAARQLAVFIEAVMSASGGNKAAVLDALNTRADQIGGLIRDLLDNTDGGASDAQEIPMSDKPELTEDEKKAQEIEARAQQKTMQMALSRLEALEERETKREADAKAAAEKAADVRISAMVADGQVHESERDDARWMLSNAPERFERVFGARKAGAAAPMSRTQAGDEKGAAQTSGATEQVAELTETELYEPEKHSLKLLTAQGVKREVALSRIREYRPTLLANAKARGLSLTH